MSAYLSSQTLTKKSGYAFTPVQMRRQMSEDKEKLAFVQKKIMKRI